MRSLAIIGTIAALLAPSAGATRSPELGRIASGLAGKPTTVECAPRSEVRGAARAWPRLRLIKMLPHYCTDIAALVARPSKAPSWKQIDAVFVLAHEAAHIYGVVDEGLTNCRALQTYEQAFLLIGMRPAYARALVDANWQGIYESFGQNFRPAACKDGSRYDIHPGTHRWP
jgi:hypothetical protein